MFNSIFYSIKLSENTKEVEIMRVGKWKHPVHGNIAITSKDMDLFVKHFDEKVRGVDIAIDLEHGVTDKKGAAAGWITSLKRIEDKLYATVNWTELGQEAISSGQYKYFSPEFKYKYKDNESGKEYKNVLLGGGLTNRPFIKGMEEVVLMSEEVSNEIENICKIEEEAKMDKELLKALKLSEDATQEQVDAAIKTQLENAVKLSEDNEKLTKKVTSLEKDKKEADDKIVALDEKVKSLEEGKTDVEKENIKLSERMTSIEKDLKESKWKEISSVAMSEGRMTKAMEDKYKTLYFKDPETAIDLISSLEPVIKLGEEGSQAKPGEETSKLKLFEDEVSKVMKEKNINYTDALVFCERNNPDLFKAAQSERGVR